MHIAHIINVYVYITIKVRVCQIILPCGDAADARQSCHNKALFFTVTHPSV